MSSLETQYNDIYDKLILYQTDNSENRNSALINQMNAQLIDIENQKKKIESLNRQRTITILPPKMIAQFEIIPNGAFYRVLADDYEELVSEYEKDNGRKIVMKFDNLGLVDFYIERFNGEERFIILVKDQDEIKISDEVLEDLNDILEKVYI